VLGLWTALLQPYRILPLEASYDSKLLICGLLRPTPDMQSRDGPGRMMSLGIVYKMGCTTVLAEPHEWGPRIKAGRREV
jgi:hypothetical protein